MTFQTRDLSPVPLKSGLPIVKWQRSSSTRRSLRSIARRRSNFLFHARSKVDIEMFYLTPRQLPCRKETHLHMMPRWKAPMIERHDVVPENVETLRCFGYFRKTQGDALHHSGCRGRRATLVTLHQSKRQDIRMSVNATIRISESCQSGAKTNLCRCVCGRDA